MEKDKSRLANRKSKTPMNVDFPGTIILKFQNRIAA